MFFTNNANYFYNMIQSYKCFVVLAKLKVAFCSDKGGASLSSIAVFMRAGTLQAKTSKP